jgi:hypothetical protein
MCSIACHFFVSWFKFKVSEMIAYNENVVKHFKAVIVRGVNVCRRCECELGLSCLSQQGHQRGLFNDLLLL